MAAAQYWHWAERNGMKRGGTGQNGKLAYKRGICTTRTGNLHTKPMQVCVCLFVCVFAWPVLLFGEG